MKPLNSLLEILTIGTLVFTLQASVTFTSGASLQVSEGQTLMALERQAATLRSTRPEMWQSYLTQTSRVFVEHEQGICRECREMPQPADLTPLKLPLVFLAAEVQQQKDSLRLRAYLDAIVLNSDPRRINLLIELQAKQRVRSTFLLGEGGWARRIAEAAELQWAAVKIRELLKADPPLRTQRAYWSPSCGGLHLSCLKMFEPPPTITSGVTGGRARAPTSAERLTGIYCLPRCGTRPRRNHPLFREGQVQSICCAAAKKTCQPFGTGRRRRQEVADHRCRQRLARLYVYPALEIRPARRTEADGGTH